MLRELLAHGVEQAMLQPTYMHGEVVLQQQRRAPVGARSQKRIGGTAPAAVTPGHNLTGGAQKEHGESEEEEEQKRGPPAPGAVMKAFRLAPLILYFNSTMVVETIRPGAEEAVAVEAAKDVRRDRCLHDTLSIGGISILLKISQGGDPRTPNKNSQGGDPKTSQGNSPGEDLRTPRRRYQGKKEGFPKLRNWHTMRKRREMKRKRKRKNIFKQKGGNF